MNISLMEKKSNASGFALLFFPIISTFKNRISHTSNFLVGCGDCGAMMIKRDVPAGGKVDAYACWTAMVLDFLPYKQPLKLRKEKLGILENILIIQGRRQEN